MIGAVIVVFTRLLIRGGLIKGLSVARIPDIMGKRRGAGCAWEFLRGLDNGNGGRGRVRRRVVLCILEGKKLWV